MPGYGTGSGGSLTIALSPTKDTLLSYYGPTNNYGITQELLVRRTGDDYVSLMQFDLSAIPSGATITNAQLQLYKYDGTTTSATINVHAMKQAWVEGTKDAASPADRRHLEHLQWNERLASGRRRERQ